MALTAAQQASGRQRVSARPVRLRVIVAGLRGIVDVQGGIETHARKLYPLLARLGCDVEVVQRRPYFPRERRRRQWRGVRLSYLWCPRIPCVETAVHTLLTILYAAVRRPDILHLHAIGPGNLAPLARLLGLRVVLTHHAMDYEREKWGTLAREILRYGERLGVRFANRTLCVSPIIRHSLSHRFGVDAGLVPNGASIVTRATTRAALDEHGLVPGRYVLSVGRPERTKRHFDLMDAFERAAPAGWKLVFVGGLEPPSPYTKLIEQRAAANRNIVLAGYHCGTSLRELYTHAGVFVLPSSSEGHPIVLLEALSFGLPVIASDIDANRAVPLPPRAYVRVGDVETLAARLSEIAAGEGLAHVDWQRVRAGIRERYSWRRAAQLTRAAYDEVAC